MSAFKTGLLINWIRPKHLELNSNEKLDDLKVLELIKLEPKILYFELPQKEELG